FDEPIAAAAKRALAVATDIFAGAIVKPDVDKIARGPARRGLAGEVMDHEASAEPIEERARFLNIPTRVAEFEHMRKVGRKELQEGLESLKIEAQAWRKLIEKRAESGSKIPRCAEHARQRFFAVLEFLRLGDEAIGFHRVAKILGCPFAPNTEQIGGGQPVETIVDFHRAEVIGIVGEPTLEGQVLRIEGPPPMAVIPSRTSDADGRARRSSSSQLGGGSLAGKDSSAAWSTRSHSRAGSSRIPSGPAERVWSKFSG